MSSREAGDTLSNHQGPMQQEIRYPTKPDFFGVTGQVTKTAGLSAIQVLIGAHVGRG